MKRFELTLVDRDETKQFIARSIDKVEGNDLVELLAQFLLVIASVLRRQEEETIKRIRYEKMEEDDIPF